MIQIQNFKAVFLPISLLFLIIIAFRGSSNQSPLSPVNTTSKKKNKNKKNKNKGINSSNGAANTVDAAAVKPTSLNVKKKKNKQKPNLGSTLTEPNTQVNLKEKHSVSTPIKHNVLIPTVENTVKNQSPNKKKRDKKKNKSGDNADKQVNKNEGKITETVQLTASKKLKNKMKERKQIGQLNRDKGKHQANKQGIGNKRKKKFQPK